MNTYGTHLRTHIFGESHGHGVGVLLDGVPPGITIDPDHIQARMDQRRPGTGPLVTARNEADEPRFLSGVHAGITTGAPVLIMVENQDTRSKDYSELLRKPRPGHSDWVARVWSHGHNDHRGGGHYSGRLTAGLVAAGAMVEPWLAEQGIRAGAHVQQIGGLVGEAGHDVDGMREALHSSAVHTACQDLETPFVELIEAARSEKDSLGGVVAWRIEGMPVAWGDPFFASIESRLAQLFFSIPAVKGVDFGAGFASTAMKGSQHNDAYHMQDGNVTPSSNHAGGILGGRSTGAPIWGRVAIKPTSSIFQEQATVDLETSQDTTLELKGRHDPCIAIRAAPVVQACLELASVDLALLARQQGHGAPHG